MVDRNVTAVLRGGVYEEGDNLSPVTFLGANRIVSGTFNQYAFEKLWSHIYNEDNPHENPFGVPEAPADGKQYGRKNESWSEIVALGTGAIPDAPVDGKIYGRENAQWKEVYIDITYSLPVALRTGTIEIPLTEDGEHLAVMTRSGVVNLPLSVAA